MIDVKGFRSSKEEPSEKFDPMGLELPANNQVKLLSGWVGGLLGLGLYLRSFLWADPVAALSPGEETPVTDPDEENASNLKSSKVGVAKTAEEEGEPAADAHASDEGEADTVHPYPEIEGRFVSMFLEPASGSLFVSNLASASANTILPPFSLFQSFKNLPEGHSPQAAVRSPQPDASVVTEEDTTDETTTEQERNRAPRTTGPVQLGDIGSGAVLAISLSYFLSGTIDPDGDAMSVSIDGGVIGHIAPHGAGWRYFADTEYLGEVEISYTITDGDLTIAQTAYLNVVANEFEGTGADDLIVGTLGRDVISGLGADDNLIGLSGHDTIDGGSGDDQIAGGDGNDFLYGGDGNDQIAGGGGNDFISGGAGDDHLYGEDGDDEIHGDAGDDEIHGGDGHDEILGGMGQDTVLAGAGDDVVSGGADDDLLSGEDGDDEIHGDSGDDEIHGGDGHDEILGGMGQDTVLAGAGDDVVSGGADDDLLSGDDGDDEIHGDAGDDEIHGGDGHDEILGGTGQDTVLAGAGDDVVSGGADDDLLSGEDGDDLILGEAGDDDISGDAGDDVLFGGEGADRLDGGVGDDVLSGEDGQDSLVGGDGDDILIGGDGADTVEGGAGNDRVIADDDDADDTYLGGDGHDQLDYSGASEAVEFDLIVKKASGESVGEDSFDDFEHYRGSNFGDHFVAGEGHAVMSGNGGADTYEFQQGDTVSSMPSSYMITDFDDDDRIWIGSGASHREIRQAQRSLEERIEEDLEDYAEEVNAAEPQLTFRHDWTDTYRRTIIEVDLDRDRIVDFELTIETDQILIVEQGC
jgi:Ca2+-binding RTX toxin-like protein